MSESGEHDWKMWSRESVLLMQWRNETFVTKFNLANRPFRWNLDTAQIAFVMSDEAVVADLCVVGSISESEGTFLWAWANEAVPRQAQGRIHEVRGFGEMHDLDLLTTAEWPGGRAEGLEMLAIAGRVLDADGVLTAQDGDRMLFFTLHRFRSQPLQEIAWLSAGADE